MLILDSGAVSRLAERSREALALIVSLREAGLWPPKVPSIVLVECLQGHAGRDANENRFLKTCEIVPATPEPLARRAALLRRLARRGSAVDALVVAIAEPGGTVLTSDEDDLGALAIHARDVVIERI
jgi:predicted nucleic acid-binding protein